MAIVWVTVALLGAVALGVVTWWLQHGSQPQSVQPAVSALPKTVNNVQNLRVQGKLDEAQKAASDALGDTSTSNDDKYLLYLQQGAAFTEQNNLQAAADSYAKANDIKETYETTGLLGLTWQQIGDKDKAIAYYKKEISLIPTDRPTAEADKDTIKQTIMLLGGQP